MLALSGTYAVFGVLFAYRTGAFRRAIQFFRRRRESQPTVAFLEPTINDISQTERRVRIYFSFDSKFGEI